MRFYSIDDVWNYLLELPNFQQQGQLAYSPGLEAIQNFCDKIGNPEKKLTCIHVGGTNGKGTVTAMLSAILQTQGYKTALYTSPHLIDFKERFKIDGITCSDSDLLNFFTLFNDIILSSNLTYFELLTAFAFWFFAKENVDIAIIEVGLGGRLDATNIIKPICSIITSIGLDHQQILGDTFAKIAFEKAGIIKPETPIVIGRLPKEATQAIQEVAKSKNAPLFCFDEFHYEIINQQTFKTEFLQEIEIKLDFSGLINIQNAVATLKALKLISDKFPVSDKSVVIGFSQVRKLSGLKGRFEKIHPQKNWFFDGAHNEEAFFWLKESLKNTFKLSDCIIVCTFMADKNYSELINAYSEFKSIYFYELNQPRAVTWEKISPINSSIIRLTEDNFSKELANFSDDVVIFTGSFYFYSIIESWIRHL